MVSLSEEERKSWQHIVSRSHALATDPRPEIAAVYRTIIKVADYLRRLEIERDKLEEARKQLAADNEKLRTTLAGPTHWYLDLTDGDLPQLRLRSGTLSPAQREALVRFYTSEERRMLDATLADAERSIFGQYIEGPILDDEVA